jgi:hypothetical protein
LEKALAALGYKKDEQASPENKPTGKKPRLTTAAPSPKQKQMTLKVATQEGSPDLELEEETAQDAVPISFIVNCNLPQSLYDKVARDGRKLWITFDEVDDHWDIEAEASQFEIERDENVALPE